MLNKRFPARVLLGLSLPFLLLLASCGTQNQPASWQVAHAGALRNIMHDGDLSAHADLQNFADAKHFYALGAVENLKGEILILNSKPYISFIQKGELHFHEDFNHKAALFVYAEVPSWKAFQVPDKITSYEDFEAFVDKTAKKQGLDMEKPFPLRLTGTAAAFDWHVIDWPEGDTAHSHEKHVSSGMNGTETNREVEILGFYSRHHHTIFTHHTTNMHLHVRTADGKIAGHVDGLSLAPGMTLFLPEN